MVVVKYSETYDLSTTRDKLGLIAIRSPTTGALNNLYDGLWKNYRYVRILSCNVALACASVLPADPQQVGIADGEIAPQDMFNPILYKAVSNESYEGLINRIYSVSTPTGGVEPVTPVTVEDFDPLISSTGSPDFDIYYSQLSSLGWKKAMPQSGLSMTNLKPLVFPILSNIGNMVIPNTSANLNYSPYPPATLTGGAGMNTTAGATFRGHGQAMPRLPTKYLAQGQNSPSNLTLPTCYVACILTPPAKQHILYYRLRVVWYVEFSEPVSNADFSTVGQLGDIGSSLYGTDIVYPDTAKDSLSTVNSVETVDVPVQQIM